MYRQLRQALDNVKQDVVKATERLIRTPSTSLSEAEVAKFVENMLHKLGYNMVFSDDVGNVVGVLIQGDAEPTILLNSHMDTVEPRSDRPWTRAPFGADIEDGKMFGVGAADCKSGLVAQMFAGHILNQTTLPLKGNLVFAATVAQENGCGAGLKHLLDVTLPQIDLKPTIAILGEPTGLNLCYGHDGFVDVDIRVECPMQAAVEEAANLILASLQCGPGKLDVAKDGRVVMSAQRPQFGVSKRGYRATVPVSRRLYPGENAGGFIAWMQRRASAVTSSIPDISVDVRAHQEPQRLYTGKVRDLPRLGMPWSVDPFEPLVDRARESLLAAGCPCSPTTWRLDELGMGTGGGNLVCDHGIPTLGFGPGEEAQAHRADEYVSVENLFCAVYGTAVLAQRFIGAPVIGVS